MGEGDGGGGWGGGWGKKGEGEEEMVGWGGVEYGERGVVEVGSHRK